MSMPGPDAPRVSALPSTDEWHPPQTPVWVWRDGGWRPGVVLAAAGPAVTIRYRMGASPGTGVDTVHWTDVCALARTDGSPV